MYPKEFEAKLRRLNEVFLEENSKLNLSAFRTQEQSWVGNVLDSLAMIDMSLLEELSTLTPLPPSPTGRGGDEGGVRANNGKNNSTKILDIGTGGGFPLLPLAIIYPDSSFTGLDSTEKKLAAVECIAKALQLTNVSTMTGRAEELGRDPNHREKYDLVLSRAVAPVNTLLEYCAPFAKVGGKVVLWKSMKIDKELKDSLLARTELSCHLVKQYEYELPGGFGKRQLLVFEKTFKTNGKYPRKTGVPKKKPIK